VLAAEGLVRLARRWRTYLLAGAMVAPLLQSGLLVAAGPYQAEAFLPVDYYRLAARLDREGVTRCVFGADLTMLWVSALSQTCDAQTDITRLPGIFERLSTATPAEAAAALPQPDDLVVWGEFERPQGPAPPGLHAIAREGTTELLSP